MALPRLILIVAIPLALWAAAPALAGGEKHNDTICPSEKVYPPPAPEEGASVDPFNAERLEGKTLHRARKMAEKHDCTVRVVKRDGESLPVTRDFRYNRINVAVRDGEVKKVFTIS